MSSRTGRRVKKYIYLWDTSSEDYLKCDKRPITKKKLARQLEEEGFGVAM